MRINFDYEGRFHSFEIEKMLKITFLTGPTHEILGRTDARRVSGSLKD